MEIFYAITNTSKTDKEFQTLFSLQLKKTHKQKFPGFKKKEGSTKGSPT